MSLVNIDFPNCQINIQENNIGTSLNNQTITIIDTSNNTNTITTSNITINDYVNNYKTKYKNGMIENNNVVGTPNQILSIDTSSNMIWKDFPNTYPQIVVIDLSANLIAAAFCLTAVSTISLSLFIESSANAKASPSSLTAAITTSESKLMVL